MKALKLYLFLALFAAVLAPSSDLQAGPSRNNRTGIGLGAGVPSQLFISGKHWFKKPGHAVDFAVSGGNGWIGGSADYLWHKFYVFKGDLGRRMPLYFGGGAGVAVSGNNLGIQAQGKGGITYFFQAPFDVFLEAVPAVTITPGVGLDIGLALGGRYYW